MSFYVLGSEPIYNYVANTYRWSFYNTFDLQQYQQCTGEVRYALSVNFKNSEVVYTTKNETYYQPERNDRQYALRQRSQGIKKQPIIRRTQAVEHTRHNKETMKSQFVRYNKDIKPGKNHRVLYSE